MKCKILTTAVQLTSNVPTQDHFGDCRKRKEKTERPNNLDVTDVQHVTMAYNTDRSPTGRQEEVTL